MNTMSSCGSAVGDVDEVPAGSHAAETHTECDYVYFTVTKSGGAWLAQIKEVQGWVFIGRYPSRELGCAAIREQFHSTAAAATATAELEQNRKSRRDSRRVGNNPAVWEYKYIRKMGSRWRAEGYQGVNMLRLHLGMFDTKLEAKNAVNQYKRLRDLREGRR